MDSPMLRILTCALLLSLGTTTALANSDAFRLKGHPLVGAWQAEAGRYYITRWGDTDYLIRSTDGKAWTLNQPVEEQPDYFLGSLDGSDTGISIRMQSPDDWVVASNNALVGNASRVQFPVSDFAVKNGEDSVIHGSILWPQTSKPRGFIIYLNGEGPNTRTDLLPTAFALLATGYGAVIFDQRHAGESTGRENSGSYFERSQRTAQDAIAVSEMVTADERIKHHSIGVLGWSQGGWIGSIVVAQNTDLDFYINVAGNADEGWQQWRHAMISRLIRSGVEQPELADANRYFDAFYGVMQDKIEWDDYVGALTTAREESWWPVMKRRYVAEWENEKEAKDYGLKEKQQIPSSDFQKVSVPSLGVFFEFDQSTAPASPGIFATALTSSNSPSFSVVQLPGLQHGSWVVEGYADSAARFSTRSQQVNTIIANWLTTTIGSE
jgi:pimeloyl-ACP methyl ester carboxylesterase